MNIKHRDIWWASFPPPSGQGAHANPRPVLVVQAKEVYSDVRVVIPFSSKNAKYKGSHFTLLIPKSDENGLSTDSTLLIFEIVLIDTAILRHRIGRLSVTEFGAVGEKLREFLDI